MLLTRKKLFHTEPLCIPSPFFPLLLPAPSHLSSHPFEFRILVHTYTLMSFREGTFDEVLRLMPDDTIVNHS